STAGRSTTASASAGWSGSSSTRTAAAPARASSATSPTTTTTCTSASSARPRTRAAADRALLPAQLAQPVTGPGDDAGAVELLDHLAQPGGRLLGLAERQEVDRQRHDLLGGRLDPGELADALIAVDPAEPGVANPAERQGRDAGVAHHRVDRGH